MKHLMMDLKKILILRHVLESLLIINGFNVLPVSLTVVCNFLT